MRCSICGAYGALEDNICPRCGAARGSSRLPVKRTTAPLVPWQRAAPVLAQGAAMIAAGVAAEWLLRSVARSVLRPPLTEKQPSRPKGKALVPRQEEPLPEGSIAVSETVVMRRVILRR